jgi:hypothetical protein
MTSVTCVTFDLGRRVCVQAELGLPLRDLRVFGQA